MQNADSRIDWIQDGVGRKREFSDCKILGSLIVTETNVDGTDLTKFVPPENVGVVYEPGRSVVEDKIRGHKSEGFSTPDTSLVVDGNDVIALVLFEARLGILAQARASEDAEAGPVPDGVLLAKEKIQRVTRQFAEISSLGGKHSIGVWFFAWLGFFPDCSLRDELMEIWMHIDPFLGKRGRVVDIKDGVSENREAISRRLNVVAERLASEMEAQEILACFYFNQVRAEKINHLRGA